MKPKKECSEVMRKDQRACCLAAGEYTPFKKGIISNLECGNRSNEEVTEESPSGLAARWLLVAKELGKRSSG